MDLNADLDGVNMLRHHSANVNETERFEFFCKSICDVYTGITPVQTSDRIFNSDFRMYQLNDIVLAHMKAPGHKAQRGHAELKRDDDDHLFLNFQMMGDYDLYQGGTSTFVGAGAPVLIDNARSFELNFDPKREMNLLSLRLPRRLVFKEDSSSELRRINLMLANSNQARFVRSQLRLLEEVVRHDARNSIKYMSLSVIQLLMHLLQTEDGKRRSYEDQSLNVVERYKTFIQMRLSDPSLCVDDLARNFGCSRRTIQNHFKQSGLLFSETVLQERIAFVCRHLLSAERKNSSQIVRLASDAGFNDISAFYKAFKRHIGTSPRKWQQQHLH